MKICPACEQQYPDELRFCQNDGTTLTVLGGTDIVGSVVADRYHITKKLGEGGMGAVYLGRHVKMGRPSAIKIINATGAQDPETIARFNREAANAARISHHNVCAIYDFGETADGLMYLAMEYVDGETLGTLVDREGALPIQLAADLIGQVAAALQAAHDLGIVHRDLKPDNVMLARASTGALTVKVVDFGIAKAMGSDTGQKVTKTGLVIGTPEYMSPEQLSGDTLDGRTDIYSLGLVAFRLFTWSLPFQAESSQEVMFKRLTYDPLRLDEAYPGGEFPDRLQDAMDLVLARMPSDRYTSAAAFAKDVAAAVRGAGGAVASAPRHIGTDQIPETRPAMPVVPRTPVESGPGADSVGAGGQQKPGGTKKKALMAGATLVGVVTIGSIIIASQNGPSPPPNGSNQDGGGPVTISASLSISSTPAGQLFVDEELVGPTPQDIEVAPGGHVIRIVAPNHVSYVDTVSVESGERLTIAGIVLEEVPPPPPVLTDATLHAVLDDMFLAVNRSNASRLRDSALGYFEQPALSDTIRALAAFVAAQSFMELSDSATAIHWAGQARQLHPGKALYENTLQVWRGRSE